MAFFYKGDLDENLSYVNLWWQRMWSEGEKDELLRLRREEKKRRKDHFGKLLEVMANNSAQSSRVDRDEMTNHKREMKR